MREKPYRIVNFLNFFLTCKIIKKNLLAFMANVFSGSFSFYFCIALMTKCTILETNESRIGQLFVTPFTSETIRMPARCHCLNNTSNDKISAFVTAWCEKYMKITFTIFSTLKLVENTILKFSKALSASKKQ